MKHLFFPARFYYSWGIVAVCFLVSFFYPTTLTLVSFVAIGLLLLTCVDLVLLFFTKGAMLGVRSVGKMMSNGDENRINLIIQSLYRLPIDVEIIDEIPVRFQERNFTIRTTFQAKGKQNLYYVLTPKERGEYEFGDIHILVTTILGLAQRRFTIEHSETVKVYPSFVNLKRFQLHAMPDRQAESTGQRKYQKGASTEFDHIKEYTRGDDIRTINWKASARRNQWMVNSYMDEKSQQVYCLIDKGRLMKFPFDGLTLLDYAIHASLMFSNVALQKDDKIGLITFADKVHEVLQPSKNKKHFNSILEMLYKQKTDYLDSDFEALYATLSRKSGQRSLLMLFTNFETYSGFMRYLQVLRAMSRKHLLCVIFFENTEVSKLTSSTAESLEDVYKQTIAEKFMYEKKLIVKELQKHGIISIYTQPKNLTVQVVNKYLDLKAKQFI